MRRAVWIFAAVGTAAPTASAAPALQAPNAQFQSSGSGSVTATVHNPNTQKGTVCWAQDTDNGSVFGSGGADSYAGPGQSITVSLRNLSGEQAHTQAFCGYHIPASGQSHDYSSSTPNTTVTVTGGGGLGTGSAGI
ncbi:hypothetical protein [Nocardia alni]|uniref:hypothetical protein n=1 Tax=Nocardia alni TaxID=2815723 RepID=UPI001C21F729|nr:hypothetical protein [Nocardia alni]